MTDRDKFLQMLGLCRRAGKLSMGHDVVMDNIVRGRAHLVLLASDGAERLKKEAAVTVERAQKKPALRCADITINEIGLAVGKNAAILAVTDEHFAARLIELLGEE